MAKLLVMTEGRGLTKIPLDKESKVPHKGAWIDSMDPELKWVQVVRKIHH